MCGIKSNWQSHCLLSNSQVRKKLDFSHILIDSPREFHIPGPYTISEIHLEKYLSLTKWERDKSLLERCSCGRRGLGIRCPRAVGARPARRVVDHPWGGCTPACLEHVDDSQSGANAAEGTVSNETKNGVCHMKRENEGKEPLFLHECFSKMWFPISVCNWINS